MLQQPFRLHSFHISKYISFTVSSATAAAADATATAAADEEEDGSAEDFGGLEGPDSTAAEAVDVDVEGTAALTLTFAFAGADSGGSGSRCVDEAHELSSSVSARAAVCDGGCAVVSSSSPSSAR